MNNREVLRHGAVAAAETFAFVGATTMLSHRQETHQSLELNPLLDRMARGVLRMTGVEPAVWAAAHTVHHGAPDANLVPIIETADYLKHRAAHPEITEPPIPETFSGLDPVAILTSDEVVTIGGLARKKVEGRYTPPASYTKADEARLLDADIPRYFYPEKPSKLKGLLKKRGKKDGTVPQPEADIYRLAPELRDPHSPPLHRDGTKGVLLHNVGLYRDAAAYFADPANRPEHLKVSKSDERGHPSGLWKAAFFAGNVALAALMRGGRKPRDLVGHAVAGSATAFAAYGGLLAGGNVTNSFGHGGKHPLLSVVTGKIEARDDGTYPSNAPALSFVTLDEVGGQYYHHKHPDWIAYTPMKGWRKLVQAPFGTMLEALANRRIGMQRGPGFELAEGELRPDVPSEAVVMIEKARAKTIAAQRAQ